MGLHEKQTCIHYISFLIQKKEENKPNSAILSHTVPERSLPMSLNYDPLGSQDPQLGIDYQPLDSW